MSDVTHHNHVTCHDLSRHLQQQQLLSSVKLHHYPNWTDSLPLWQTNVEAWCVSERCCSVVYRGDEFKLILEMFQLENAQADGDVDYYRFFLGVQKVKNLWRKQIQGRRNLYLKRIKSRNFRPGCLKRCSELHQFRLRFPDVQII